MLQLRTMLRVLRFIILQNEGKHFKGTNEKLFSPFVWRMTAVILFFVRKNERDWKVLAWTDGGVDYVCWWSCCFTWLPSSKQCTYMILQISKVIRTICLFNVLFVHLHRWKQWICIVFSSPGTGLFSENARHFSYEQLLHTSIPYRYIGPFIKAQHNSDLRNFSNR